MTRRTFFLAPGMTALAAAAPALTKVRVSGTRTMNLSPLHVAMENGYFREQGLEVELLAFSRSTEAIPVLAQGGLDVAIYALSPPTINAIGKGVRIRLVAARDEVTPGCGDAGSVYCHSSIQSVAGLKGKKVANGFPGGISEFGLDMALAKAGLQPSDIEQVKLNAPEAAQAVLRGEIHALTGPDLANMKVLKRPEFRLLTTMGQTIPGFQMAHVMYGKQLLDGPIDTGVKFLQALGRGLREYRAGATPAFLVDFAQKAGLDMAGVKAMCREHVVVDGRVDLPSLTRFTEWAYRKGYSEKQVPAASLVDERFLTAAGLKA